MLKSLFHVYVNRHVFFDEIPPWQVFKSFSLTLYQGEVLECGEVFILTCVCIK